MSIIQQYLNQTANIATKKGRDVYGKTTENAAVSVPVRFQESSKRTKDAKGVEITVDGEFWTNPDVSVGIDDVLEVDSVKYRVVKVDRKVGFDGKPSHRKGYVVRVAV